MYLGRYNKDARTLTTNRFSSHNPLQTYYADPMSTFGLTVTCGTDLQRAAVLQQMIRRSLNSNWPVIVLYTGNTVDEAIAKMLPYIQIPTGAKTVVRPHVNCTYNPLFGMNAGQAKTTILGTKSSDIDADTSDLLEHLLKLLPLLNYPIDLSSLCRIAGMNWSTLQSELSAHRVPASCLTLNGNALSGYYAAVPGQSRSTIQEVRNLISGFKNGLENELWMNGCQTESILSTIIRRGFMAIRVTGNAETSPSLQYLAKELEYACSLGRPFLLACCDVIIPQSSSFATFLNNHQGNYSLFVSARDLPSCFPGASGQEYWGTINALTQQLMVLHCAVPGSAEPYSKLFGNYIRHIEIQTYGTHRAPFALFQSHSASHVLKEDEVPRVTHKQLTDHLNGGAFWQHGSDTVCFCHNFGIPNSINWG